MTEKQFIAAKITSGVVTMQNANALNEFNTAAEV